MWINLKYDDKSIWEGNRDFEDIKCPVCGTIIDRVFTDLNPAVEVVKKGTIDDK